MCNSNLNYGIGKNRLLSDTNNDLCTNMDNSILFLNLEDLPEST